MGLRPPGRLGGDLATRGNACIHHGRPESSAIATDSTWSRLGDLNPGPTHYECVALPLS
jgi:hypothetical protein